MVVRLFFTGLWPFCHLRGLHATCGRAICRFCTAFLGVVAVAKAKLMLPDGRLVDGVEVGVDETTERWSDIKLADGALLRVKMTVVSALRAEDEYDQTGQPIYSLNMAPVIAVNSVPDKLKKKRN